MRYIVLILTLFVISLIARDNPFEPIESSATIGHTTYKKENRKNFSKIEFQLPSSARILKSVSFEYQNLDGSLESKTVKIDQKIDWHDKLIVKKYDYKIKSSTQKIEKEKNINFKDIVLFSIKNNTIQIKTKDKKLRDFLITKPYKIVVDFKREISFYTKKYDLKSKYFKSIIIGKHDGYYRIAIKLDGKYLYNKTKTKDGYMFTLK